MNENESFGRAAKKIMDEHLTPLSRAVEAHSHDDPVLRAMAGVAAKAMWMVADWVTDSVVIAEEERLVSLLKKSTLLPAKWMLEFSVGAHDDVAQVVQQSVYCYQSVLVIARSDKVDLFHLPLSGEP